MTSFELSKWYFDVLNEQQNYAFCYIALVRLLGSCRLVTNVTIASPSQCSPETITWEQTLSRFHSLSSGLPGMTARSDGGWEVRLTHRTAEVDLQYVPLLRQQQCASPLIIPRGRRCINWAPILPIALVSGHIRIVDLMIDLQASHGYADYLHSTVFPLFAPVKAVLWGRLLNKHAAIIYTITISQKTNQQWTQMVVITESTFHTFHNCSIHFEDPHATDVFSQHVHPHRFLLEAADASGKVEITIEHNATAAINDFISDQEVSNPFFKKLYTWLSKHPQGIKYFSTGMGKIELLNTKIIIPQCPMIDEVVIFR
jgi:hypothetical protein